MDIFEEITYDKTAWAEQKKAQRDAVFAKIDEYLDSAAMDPAALQTYLDVQAQFPLCSVSNAVLIAAQFPESTEYHTFEDWKKKEVSINKGEQSFSMLVPNGTYTGKDGKAHTSFDVQKVFDISQTSAEVVQRKPDLRLSLKAMLMRPVCPIQVDAQQTGAVFVSQENKIVIGKGMTLEDTLETLSMALAHGEMNKSIPDYKPGLPQNSFYARCVSYMVCRHYGVDPKTYNFSDMQMVLGNCNSKELRGHLETIRSTARLLIDRVEKAKTTLLNLNKTEQDRDSR